MKPKIFVTRRLPQPVMDRLETEFDLAVNHEDRVLTKSEIIAGVKGRDALLCLLTDTIDEEVITAEPNLKVISNYAVGYNNIDIECAAKHHIPVCFTPGVLTETTADLAWALLLAVARRVVPSDQFTRQGKFRGWGPELFLGSDVFGKTLGIVGMGRIGEAVARRATGFQMEVLYTKRTPLPESHRLASHAQHVGLQQLLQNSDYVSIHVPFSPETKHMIGERELDLMKPAAYLINTARGPIIDEKALAEALKTGRIAGAGLDVYEREPEMEEELVDLENAVLLPHTGSATLETRTKMGMMAVENALAILNATKPHAVVN